MKNINFIKIKFVSYDHGNIILQNNICLWFFHLYYNFEDNDETIYLIL